MRAVQRRASLAVAAGHRKRKTRTIGHEPARAEGGRLSRLTDLLGIAHPILQAPMAGSTTPALAAAVASAGALGGLGAAMHAPQAMAAEVDATRARTNGAFQVNFFTHAPPEAAPEAIERTRALLAPIYAERGLGPVPPGDAPPPPPYGEETMEAVLAARPPVVSFHFGLPEPRLMAPLKAAGIVVLSTATTPAEARWLEERGVDAIIAQGWEAGGHHGWFLDGALRIGTMALVPQVVDAVAVPVIAAGGIADGRGIAAALALGAEGVQMGTAFLSTAEAATPPAHRRAMAGAKATEVTPAFSGRPARGVLNDYIARMRPHDDALPPFPLMRQLTAPLAAADAEEDEAAHSPVWAGQAVGLGRDTGAAALVEALVRETEEALARLAKM
ncbi:MAG TPA: nitronate monooxygenase [Thermohalobaculum sp.]|nr:nitronate monooxygenase [Thermohalobaculum sp.]